MSSKQRKSKRDRAVTTGGRLRRRAHVVDPSRRQDLARTIRIRCAIAKISYISHEFYRVADGLIAEEWICSDMASLFSQLG